MKLFTLDKEEKKDVQRAEKEREFEMSGSMQFISTYVTSQSV